MGDYHDFAMVISVEPQAREAVWERAVKLAKPPTGVQVRVQSPSLLMCMVEADAEYLAIERVNEWLTEVAKSAGVAVALNPQPSNEV